MSCTCFPRTAEDVPTPEKGDNRWRKFAGFLVVGSIGLLVDVTGYLIFRETLNWPVVAARLGAFWPATIVTWWLNRTKVFTQRSQERAPWFREYFAYLTVQSLGSATNLTVFFLATYLWPDMPSLLALAAGSVVAMGVNFTGISTWVFRHDLHNAKDTHES